MQQNLARNNTQNAWINPTNNGTIGGDNNTDLKQMLNYSLSPGEQEIYAELNKGKESLKKEYKPEKEGGKDYRN